MMRTTGKVILVGLLVASLIGEASATTQHGVFVRCSFQLRDTSGIYRGTGTYRGGTAKCGKRFGKGRYSGRYRDMVTPPTGIETGSSKFTFHAGTVRAAYEFSGVITTTRYRGVMHVLGGTGRFKHAAGTLRLRCTKHPPDAACTASGRITGIARSPSA